MTNFPNSDFPISSSDCAEIEAIFIELVQARDTVPPAETATGEPANAVLPFLDPYGNVQDLHS
jgi:hypothetical protein